MVKNIVSQGNIIVKEHRKELFQIFLLLLIFESIQSTSILFGGFGILISILTISLKHVQTIAGLKVTGQKNEPININDGLCFFKRFKELFSTYFWVVLINTVVVVALTIAVVNILTLFIDSATAEMLFEQVLLEQSYGVSDLGYYLLIYVLIIGTLVGVGATFITDCICFMAPFVLEMKGLKGLKALKHGWQLSKGHWLDIIRLETYYLLPIILFACLDFLATYYLIDYAMILQIVNIFLSVLAVFAYRMEQVVSRALLYQKVEEV